MCENYNNKRLCLELNDINNQVRRDRIYKLESTFYIVKSDNMMPQEFVLLLKDIKSELIKKYEIERIPLPCKKQYGFHIKNKDVYEVNGSGKSGKPIG